MTRMNRRTFRLAAAAIGLLLASVFLAGCFNPFNPLVARGRAGVSEPPPIPNRPEEVIKLFRWCWEHRAITEYEELFTEDFLFAFAETDSAGRAFQGAVLRRIDEVETARHLFVGGGTSPPANNITLQLDQNLIPQPDDRAGKQDTTYHQMVITSVVLRIDTDEEDFEVTGTARFFVIRGDSALIPEEIIERGILPDKGRWFIERWEDETLGSIANSAYRARRARALGAPPPVPSGARAPGVQAAQDLPLDVTWGFVKSVFHPSR